MDNAERLRHIRRTVRRLSFEIKKRRHILRHLLVIRRHATGHAASLLVDLVKKTAETQYLQKKTLRVVHRVYSELESQE